MNYFRVDPAIITDCDPGDIFIIRNVANLVAPYHVDGGLHGTSSALEYAIKVLNVENINFIMNELLREQYFQGYYVQGLYRFQA